MRSGILILLLCGLAGCAVQPTSTVEPPDDTGWHTPAPNNGAVLVPTPGVSRGSVTPTRPASQSPTARRPATVAYSPNSTGVSATDVLLRESKTLYQRSDYSSAANNFERGIRMAPRSSALYLALAKTRLAMGDNNNAIQMANRAISLLPAGSGAAAARAEAWSVIADAKEANGDRNGAAAARQKARGW